MLKQSLCNSDIDDLVKVFSDPQIVLFPCCIITEKGLNFNQ